MWLVSNTAPTDMNNARSFSDGGFGLVKQFKSNFGGVSDYVSKQWSIMETVRQKLLKKSRQRRGEPDEAKIETGQSVAIEVCV